MYYIERNPITDAMFLEGSVPEPAPSEPAWVSGTAYPIIGTEVTRANIHRVFRSAVEIPAGTVVVPEQDPTRWTDMRPTLRHRPFGPHLRADGMLFYKHQPVQSTTEDISYRLRQRYANAVAIFGAKGAHWRVRVYKFDGGPLAVEHTGRIKSAARGFWDYRFGQRTTTDRVLVHGLPIFPAAVVHVTIEGTGTQLRAVSQIEVGKLRYIPGVDLEGPESGVEFGLVRAPRVLTSRKADENGSTSVLIYGATCDMSGTAALSSKNEDSALYQLLRLVGKGVAFTPTLLPGYRQSLLFGILKSAPMSRDNARTSSFRFEIEGLPTTSPN
ncbi:hypothetical protein OIN59_11975 [Acidovorax sp. D2M1]|uniref:Phage tail protein n=1 Tax=Acidovorax benzenivorans TaxID=2987520 RepID=A0ABT5RWS5_9BURK|nr:hypothetical protein [Acidovorax benzenivorans]MDD2178153.1 hypothetical protein [Acidovorax benzenivorans]